MTRRAKSSSAGSIQRHDEDTAQHAAEKRCDPLGAVFSPQHDALAYGDLAAHQFGGKALGKIGQIR